MMTRGAADAQAATADVTDPTTTIADGTNGAFVDCTPCSGPRTRRSGGATERVADAITLDHQLLARSY